MDRPVFGRGRRDGGRATAAATEGVARLDPDRRLVRAAQADPLEFEALYRKYLAQVYSFALYELRDHHEAEDVTERAFMLALAGIPGFRERDDAPAAPETAGGEAAVEAGASTFRAWLFRIARNVVANQRRTARRRPVAPLELAVSIADPLDVASDIEIRDEARAAWAAVGRLPGDRRRVVTLRFVEEMSAAEIADVLGRSEGAVRVLLHRALRSVAADLRGTHRSGRGPAEAASGDAASGDGPDDAGGTE
jgi:RNA polymerase sigma-70 factor (ECF subfamily)